MHDGPARGLSAPPEGRTGWPWTCPSGEFPDRMPGGAPWPKISVVTPSLNQGRFIEEAIRSVLLQGYPDLEYIVMDGGSTDGSVDIIKKYGPFLSHFGAGPDGGQTDAIGKGFEKANGEILTYLCSDDRYLPGAFERTARFFSRNPRIAFANGDINYIDEEGRVTKRFFVSRPLRMVTANLGRHTWPQQSCFWRRWAYEKCGGMDASFAFAMDKDLFLRLTAAGSSKRIPGPPLGEFRLHGGSKTSTMMDVCQSESRALLERDSDPFLRRFPRFLNAFYWAWQKPASIRMRVHKYFGLEY